MILYNILNNPILNGRECEASCQNSKGVIMGILIKSYHTAQQVQYSRSFIKLNQLERTDGRM